MIFRKATIQDLDTILKIEQLVFNTDSYPPFVIRQLFDISGHYFVVAEAENKILGFVIGGLNTEEQKSWILSLGVHPEARGKGIGKQLTERLIAIFKAEKAKCTLLTAYPDNVSAIKIYKSLGFEGEEVLDNYFLDNEKRIVMTLKLS